MKNAVIYARYSAGPNQTEQSIEGQLRVCTEYAEKNDLRIVGTYIDRKISGKIYWRSRTVSYTQQVQTVM